MDQYLLVLSQMLTATNNTTTFQAESPTWLTVYTDEYNFWTMTALNESVYVFRVRAKNMFGWSNFSEVSQPLDFAQVLESKQFILASSQGMNF